MSPSEPDFSTTRALVTGSARGIGLGIAAHLAGLGADVVIADLNATLGEAAAEKLRSSGLKVSFIHADLSHKGAAAQLVESVFSEPSAHGILVNNARARGRQGFMDQDEDSWALELQVNLNAAFFASQAFARVRSGKAGGGSIVNICSVASLQVTNESPGYHASKSALAQLTRYVAVHAAPLGIRCNAVLPGLIIQEEHQARFNGADNQAFRDQAQAYQPGGLPGHEADVARAVAFLCDPNNTYLNGASLTLDGAATTQEPFGLLIRKNLHTEKP